MSSSLISSVVLRPAEHDARRTQGARNHSLRPSTFLLSCAFARARSLVSCGGTAVDKAHDEAIAAAAAHEKKRTTHNARLGKHLNGNAAAVRGNILGANSKRRSTAKQAAGL